MDACALKVNNRISFVDNINSYWIPNIDTMQKAYDDSIDCLECLPICTKTNYRVLASYFDLKTTEQSKIFSPFL